MHTSLLLILVTGALLVVKKTMDVQRVLREIGNWPGYRALLPTVNILSALSGVRNVKWVYREGPSHHSWKSKHAEFAECSP
ncbi:hypothetical protein BC835DRAFT_347053 [Cytidiella melzeri]|nr:hypothetical protein BC835DRAFT_347053 [Cytidiella melzeri]